MPVNIGHRYVLRPANDGYVGYLVPMDFNTSAVKGFEVFFFRSRGTNDSKFIDVPLKEKGGFPEFLYRTCLMETDKILQHCKRSGYRKYHEPLLYDFIVESSVRQEVLREVKFVRSI